ncbi:MAG TPA: hypothetical protein VFP99_09110 [Chthoniobacterales bacterium]|nr:hypothetical protein [Chthoniobacterales bacterium]
MLGVTLGFHFVGWNEAQGGGVHGITLAGGRSGVFEDVAEVRITELGAGLTEIADRCNYFLFSKSGKYWP